MNTLSIANRPPINHKEDGQQPQTPKQAAVAAARDGLYVFPIPPGMKQTRHRDWPNRNNSDPAFIAGHWPSEHTNYGIACKRSGLTVLDLDVSGPTDITDHHGVPEGARGLAHLCTTHNQEWPDTRTIITPRGGWHLLFRTPPGRHIRNTAGTRIGEHADVRGNGNGNGGGYIVGAGSILTHAAYSKPVVLFNDGRYIAQEPIQPIAALPAWLTEILDPPPPPRRPQPSAAPYKGTCEAGHRVTRLVDELISHATPGNRNNTLNKYAYTFRTLISEGVITRDTAEQVLWAAAEQIGLAHDEPATTHRTIQSALGGTL